MNSLIHQVILWILVPIICVIGFVLYQLDNLHNRFIVSLEQNIAREAVRVERELHLVLQTTEQLASMVARDWMIVEACKNRATDTLFQAGSNIIASTLIDRITFADVDGIVLARGHDEFAFNDSIGADRLFLLGAKGEGRAGLVRQGADIILVAVRPITEFGAVTRGVLIVSRTIKPHFIERVERELGLVIAVEHHPDKNFLPDEQASEEGVVRFTRQMSMPSLEEGIWTATIRKNYQAERAVLNAARSKIVAFTMLATAAALCFVWFSVHYLLRPVRRLRTWLQQHREGSIRLEDLNANIVSQNDARNELGYIAHSALATIQELERARTQLEGMHKDLEFLVEERTKELVTRTQQLRQEIEEREQAERSILGLKNHLQHIFDSMRCALIGINSARTITFVNSQAATFCGLSPDQLHQASVDRVLACYGLSDHDLLDRAGDPGEHWRMGRYTTRHQGQPMHLDVTTYPFRFGVETGLIIRIDDVSRQVAMEQELFKIEKLKSIGLLAGGIAHDFNNYLAVILGSVNLALHNDQLDAHTKGLLSRAEAASISASELTEQLLTFAKGGEPRKRLISLAATIREAARQASLEGRMQCRVDIPEDMWTVEADRAQIRQVVQNMVVNAVQALQDGGSLEISCANVNADDEWHLAQLPPGPYLRITIADNGTGMSSETLARIFDPFFSTKPEGYGLGLAICHAIISKHEGAIAVESSPGHGTTFFLYLPARPGALPDNPAEDDAARDMRPSMRVLVVDDEPMIREVVGAMLDVLGHQVLFARDGAEAVINYQQSMESGVPFDLVLMDLIIPGGMGGKEAAREILRLNPTARLIVSSGYSNDPILANFREYGFVAAIAKPYQLKDLARILAGS